MKKILPWVFLLSIFIFLIAWGAMGIKLADGAYEIEAFAYIVLSSMVVMFGFILYKAFFRKKMSTLRKNKANRREILPILRQRDRELISVSKQSSEEGFSIMQLEVA